jgi:hypothetical protein
MAKGKKRTEGDIRAVKKPVSGKWMTKRVWVDAWAKP